MNKINELTEKQEALIPIYREKWQKIAFSTAPIDKDRVTAAIKQVYVLLNKPEPIIAFCPYPNLQEEILFDCGLNSFGLNFNARLKDLMIKDVLDRVYIKCSNYLATRVKYYNFDIVSIWDLLRSLNKSLDPIVLDKIKDYIIPYKNNKSLIKYGIFADFFAKTLDLTIEKSRWQLFLDIVNNCGEIMLYENICLVCERPITSISVNSENKLHCDRGEPALKFTNGVEIYAYGSLVIPEQYGRVPANCWKTEWLLEENEPTLKELLIQVIGKERIRNELQTTEKINKAGRLTHKQDDLTRDYQYKWQDIAFSIATINKNCVKKYINKAYGYINLEQPKILFFDSPYSAQNYINKFKKDRNTITKIEDEIYEPVQEITSLFPNLKNNNVTAPLLLQDIAKGRLYWNSSGCWVGARYDSLFDVLRKKIEQDTDATVECIASERFITNASMADFLLSVLNYSHNRELLEIFVGLVKHCGWIYPYRDICLVSRSPIESYLNEDLELHAIEKPAILFADGFGCYAYEGTFLPDKYGKLHPDKWNSQWIVEEEDIDIRYALIKGIGYDRISEELPAEVIATSESYGILKLTIDDNFEWVYYGEYDRDRRTSPIMLFKMPHPKTNLSLTLRLPFHVDSIDSIEAAIAWVDNAFDF